MAARFFGTPEAFRRWMEQNHAAATGLVVGFWKASSGRGGLTYPQALDEALCFGWIDGVRGNLDEERWTIRFTPRKPRSIWSGVNIRHVERLISEGRMRPAGMKAFQARDEKRSRVYSYEATQDTPLGEAEAKALRANGKAQAYFDAQRPSYRKTASHWVMSAKKEETRRRRLEALIACCAKGEWLPQYRWGKQPKAAGDGKAAGRTKRGGPV